VVTLSFALKELPMASFPPQLIADLTKSLKVSPKQVVVYKVMPVQGQQSLKRSPNPLARRRRLLQVSDYPYQITLGFLSGADGQGCRSRSALSSSLLSVSLSLSLSLSLRFRCLTRWFATGSVIAQQFADQVTKFQAFESSTLSSGVITSQINKSVPPLISAEMLYLEPVCPDGTFRWALVEFFQPNILWRYFLIE
jgi:hypothetical protein